MTRQSSCHKSASQTSSTTTPHRLPVWDALSPQELLNPSLPITLPTTHWRLTFYTASWEYGNAWLPHKNQSPAQSDVGTEKVTSLALVRGPHSGLYHLEYLANRVGMAGHCCSVVFWELLQVSEVKALFVAMWSFAAYDFSTKVAPGSEDFWKKLALLLFAERHLLLGNVRESDSLVLKYSVSVNQQINRQDVELFSLKINTVTKFCPSWDS